MLLWIILIGILTLTFFLQLEFYKENLQSLIFAIGIILVFDVVKVSAEISIFGSTNKIGKALFTLLAMSLIVFSSFATFSTRIYLSESNKNMAQARQSGIDQKNDEIKTRKELLKKELSNIDSQIEQKQNMISAYQSDTEKNRYLIWRLNKEINGLNQQRKVLNPQLLTHIRDKEIINSKITMTGSIERVTGWKATSITTFVYAFQSLLLEIGVFILCFFLGKSYSSPLSKIVKKDVKIVSNSLVEERQNLSKTQLTGGDIRQIRVRLNKSQEQLAKELGIHQRKLSRLENGQTKIGTEIEEKLMSMTRY